MRQNLLGQRAWLRAGIVCLIAILLLVSPALTAMAGELISLPVTRVIAHEGAFYTDFYRLRPGGIAWTRLPGNSKELEGIDWAQAPALPLVRCLESASQICYRIDGAIRVDQTDDGGRTWTTAWRLPTGRIDYVRRSGDTSAFKTFDLALLEVDAEHLVAVAMGTQGVLVRDTNGEWHRTAVEDARPSPLAARSLGAAYEALLVETTLWGLLTLLIAALRLSRVQSDNISLVFPTGVGALLLGIIGCMSTAYLGSYGVLITFTLAVPLLICTVVWLSWRLENRGDLKQASADRWLASTAGTVLGGLAPLYLWAFGLIPWYAVALGLSGVLVWKAARLPIHPAPVTAP